MTGREFRELRERTGHTLRSLAERWGVGFNTIRREECKDEVRGLYRDAMRTVASESQDDKGT